MKSLVFLLVGVLMGAVIVRVASHWTWLEESAGPGDRLRVVVEPPQLSAAAGKTPIEGVVIREVTREDLMRCSIALKNFPSPDAMTASSGVGSSSAENLTQAMGYSQEQIMQCVNTLDTLARGAASLPPRK